MEEQTYEAIFAGPKGSSERFNNGEINYILFEAGKPVPITEDIAEQLREDKRFVVRVRSAVDDLEESDEEMPMRKKKASGKKRATKKK